MKNWLVGCIAAVMSVMTVQATTRYVDYNSVAAGDDTNHGTEAAPWRTLAYAAKTAEANDEIILAKGTHTITSNITIDKALDIHGAGENWETILDANHQKYYVYVKGEGAKLSNFTFYRIGEKNQNSDVQLTANATISNVVFTACGVSSGNNQWILDANKGLVSCCWFTNNAAFNNAGMYIKGSVVVENCVFVNNSTASGANGLGILHIPADASNTAVIRNCTIAHNSIGGTTSAVYSYNWDGKCKFYNNIVYGNYSKDDPTVARNLVTDAGKTLWWLSNYITPLASMKYPAKNYEGDPKLMADWMHLAEGSPCIGAALTGSDSEGTAYSTAYDITGKARGSTPAIGAFEYVEVEMPIYVEVTTPKKSKVYLPDALNFSCAVTGGYKEPLAYLWDFSNDGTVVSEQQNPTLAIPGTYIDPTLTVTDSKGRKVKTTVSGTFTVIQPSDSTYYVDYKAGADTNDGLTEDTAWKTLAHAVDVAAEGDTIVLAKGTHTLEANFSTAKRLTIRGAGETTIDDNHKSHTFTISSDGAVLNNLTFTRFCVQDSIYMSGPSTISNCVFTGFKNVNDYVLRFIRVSDGLFSCCMVTNNVGGRSAGMYMSGASVVENSIFINNKATSTSNGEGVLHLVSGTAVLRNCTIANNTIGHGAAFYYQEASWEDKTMSKIYNNIIWNNTLPSGETKNWMLYRSEPLKYTVNWYGNFTTGVANLKNPSENHEVDPQLEMDGYHLKEASPCRNAAKTGDDADGVAYASACDFTGVARPATPAAGAMEYVKLSIPLSVKASGPYAKKAYLPDTLTFTSELGGDYEEPVTYVWNFDGEGEVVGSGASPVLSTPGVYVNPTVTVTDKNGQTATGIAEGTFTVVQLTEKAHYVDPVNGDDEAEGSAVAPLKTLAAAVDKAAEGNEIVLKAGTYPIASTINVTKRLFIRGEGAKEDTILDASTKSGVGFKVNEANGLVCNLTLTHFDNQQIYLNAASTISNIVVTDCGRSTTDGTIVKMNAGLLTHSWITNNVAGYNAGVVMDGNSTLENCAILNNRSTYTSDAVDGSALAFPHGSGVRTVRNCTIAGNTFSHTNGVAVYGYAWDAEKNESVHLYNTIIWSNTCTKAGATHPNVYNGNAKKWTVKNNCWDYNDLTRLQDPEGGKNVCSVLADPQFDAEKGGAPFISRASPCKNAGDDDYAPTGLDLLGNPRKLGRHVDIGAVEFDGYLGTLFIVK